MDELRADDHRHRRGPSGSRAACGRRCGGRAAEGGSKRQRACGGCYRQGKAHEISPRGGDGARGARPAPAVPAISVAWTHQRIGDGRMKLKLDLHDIYNRGQDIDRALQGIIDEAVRTKAPLVEIIPGKGSGQLKKHVLKFLERKDIKALYHRVEKDSKNFGRLFVHFRWK